MASGNRSTAAWQQELRRHESVPYSGWKVALPVALVDIAKGAVPVLWFGRCFVRAVFPLGGIMAVWECILGVRGLPGGKGVATAAGMCWG